MLPHSQLSARAAKASTTGCHPGSPAAWRCKHKGPVSARLLAHVLQHPQQSGPVSLLTFLREHSSENECSHDSQRQVRPPPHEAVSVWAHRRRATCSTTCMPVRNERISSCRRFVHSGLLADLAPTLWATTRSIHDACRPVLVLGHSLRGVDYAGCRAPVEGRRSESAANRPASANRSYLNPAGSHACIIHGSFSAIHCLHPSAA